MASKASGPLVYDLHERQDAEGRFDRICPPNSVPADPHDDYAVTADVELELRVRRDGDKCRFFGHVRSRLRLTCGRCLEPYEVPTDISVDLLYLPQSSNRGEEEAEVGADDLSTAFYRDERIDLGQMVREQFVLSVPMKPLCRDDCRGLCSMCGTNLNVDTCACEPRWRDPRLAVLETFRVTRSRRDGGK